MILILRTLAIGLGLIAALIASQLPEFTQQYRQRLGGAIDEVRTVVARFDADARINSLTRRDALAKLAQSQDDLVRRRAQDVVANVSRLEALEAQARAMRDAGPVARVGYFMRYADPALVQATMKDFEPALPVTSEGAIATAAGFVAGWGVVQLAAWPLRRWRETRVRRRSFIPR
jgi:hypothetical protein